MLARKRLQAKTWLPPFYHKMLAASKTIVIQLLSRFIVVGALNTLLGFTIVFALMYIFGVSPELSNLIGYSVGLFTTYFSHRKFTFNSNQAKFREFIKFVTVFCISYVSNFLFLFFLIHHLKVNSGVSQFLALMIYIVCSFLMNKYFVFNSQGQESILHRRLMNRAQHSRTSVRKKN